MIDMITRRVGSLAVRLLTACMLLASVAGCSLKVQHRTLADPSTGAGTLDEQSPFLKAHLPDGTLLVFTDWRLDEEAGHVAGVAERFDVNRRLLAHGPAVVPLDSVSIFESNVLQTSPAIAGLTVMSVATAAMTVFCITNPKACYGSCPTFHAPGEDGAPLLQAEGFSASVAPILEANDIDQLARCRVSGRTFELVMANEALETHVVRQVDLLVAPKPIGGRVFAGEDGTWWNTGEPIAPRLAVAAEGDIAGLLRDSDADERFSSADASDLAARESIELEFADVPAGPLGLVLVSRQTLLSTYVFYQGLAYLGEQAAPTLARARQVLEPADGGNTIGGLLGRIAVGIADDQGDWLPAGAVGETGPLAPNTHLVTLPETSARPVRIRLNLARGCWRLDQAALVSLQGPAAVQRLSPVQVRRHDAADPDALNSLNDPERTLVTFPGDRFTLVYDLPADGEGLEFFVDSRGYYLEWMRREWSHEENAGKAAMLILAPAAMLKEMAPAFKREEPSMEASFWGSRYGR